MLLHHTCKVGIEICLCGRMTTDAFPVMAKTLMLTFSRRSFRLCMLTAVSVTRSYQFPRLTDVFSGLEKTFMLTFSRRSFKLFMLMTLTERHAFIAVSMRYRRIGVLTPSADRHVFIAVSMRYTGVAVTVVSERSKRKDHSSQVLFS